MHCVAVSSLGLAVKFHEEIDAESEAFEANRAAAIILAIPSPEPLNSDELAAEIRAQSEFSQKVFLNFWEEVWGLFRFLEVHV